MERAAELAHARGVPRVLSVAAMAEPYEDEVFDGSQDVHGAYREFRAVMTVD